MAQPPDVFSAGAVVFRPGRQVLLVHRQRYDDWSFPKGKLDRGEHRTTAAVREIEEETGVHARLGVPLADQRYSTGRRMKTVHYWVGRAVGDDDVSGYELNDEISGVEWVDVAEATGRLTYRYDRATLAEAMTVRKRTETVIVLRHAQARSRRTWRDDDRLRPLLQTGRVQALRLAPVVAAYDVGRVVTSSSTRCAETVAPYVNATGPEVRRTDRLSQEDARPKKVGEEVEELLAWTAAHHRGALLCTHRPVLPMVFDRLGVEDPGLELGEMLVVHLRKGVVHSTERHPFA